MSYGYISCSISVAIYSNHMSSFRKKITITKSKNIRPLTSTPFQPLKHVFSGCQSVPRLKCQNRCVSVKICVFLKGNMSRAYFAVDWKKKKKENVIHLWQTGHINDNCTWMARIFFKRNIFWKLIGFRSFKNG